MRYLIVLLMLLIAMPSIGQHQAPFFMGEPDEDDGMLGGDTEAPIESWVFSNSSTLPTGSYDYIINTVGGSGELNEGSPTSVKSTSSALRIKINSTDLPIDMYSEIGMLYDYDVSNELAGKEIVKATIHWMIKSYNSMAFGNDIRIDVIGLIDGDIDDWVDYSTSTTSDVCYDYYDASESSSWVTAISAYDEDSPDDGLADTHLEVGTFWGIRSDTTMNAYSGSDVMHVDVTEQVKAWASGRGEGGFLVFGKKESGNMIMSTCNVNDSSTSCRPFLEVFAR